MIDELRNLLWYIRFFSSFDDALQYRQLRDRPEKCADPVPLRLRSLGGKPLLCRPGTTDIQVLLDTFVRTYHRPPVRLREDAIILDLGANVGYTMADFAFQYPHARICGVELDETNAAFARQNVAAFGPRCKVLHGAVWQNTGRVRFKGTEAWAYRVDESDCFEPPPETATAPAYTVDEVLARFGLDESTPIDFMKMDIEGAETVVLQPSAAWLSRVQCIKLEWHPPASPGRCADVLASAGLRVRPDPVHPRGLVAIRN